MQQHVPENWSMHTHPPPPFSLLNHPPQLSFCISHSSSHSGLFLLPQHPSSCLSTPPFASTPVNTHPHYFCPYVCLIHIAAPSLNGPFCSLPLCCWYCPSCFDTPPLLLLQQQFSQLVHQLWPSLCPCPCCTTHNALAAPTPFPSLPPTPSLVTHMLITPPTSPQLLHRHSSHLTSTPILVTWALCLSSSMSYCSASFTLSHDAP